MNTGSPLVAASPLPRSSLGGSSGEVVSGTQADLPKATSSSKAPFPGNMLVPDQVSGDNAGSQDHTSGQCSHIEEPFAPGTKLPVSKTTRLLRCAS